MFQKVIIGQVVRKRLAWLCLLLLLPILSDHAALAQITSSSSKGFFSKLASRKTLSLKASFSYSPTYPTEGQTVQFTDTSTGNPTSWQWDFGDGSVSSEQNPSHPFLSPGFRKVTLTIFNNDVSRTTKKTITIMPAPASASFVYSPTSPVAGQTVQFADTSSGDPTSWQWDFGDGSTSTAKNPSHVYTRASSYIVTLVSGSSSGSKKGSQTISVASTSSLSASFSHTPTSPVAGQAVQFTDTSVGNPASWQWSFGDGTSSTAQNPSHSYAASGSYVVNLVIANSTESKSTSRTVTVVSDSSLQASFAYNPPSPVQGQAIQFTDTSTGSPTSWHWNFGDGTTSTIQNPSHTYGSAGSFGVTLTATNNTGSTNTTRTLAVAPPLSASFSYSPASPVIGQAVHFSDTSTGIPTSWQWDFNDGKTSTEQHPSHTFMTAGVFTVSLLAANSSGSNSVSYLVNVVAGSDLLPLDRRISWRPGIPGGIPSYAVGVNAADYGANGNDALDDTTAIQNAINACGAERAVYIPEGTYYISSLVLQNRRIVLRGAGPTKTVLRSNAGNHAIRIIGASAERGPISISSGAEKGSSTVRVSNTSGVAVGEIWSVYPNAAMPVESTSGVNSNCEWYDNFGQLVKITGKTSSSVTFSPALYYDISGYDPQMKKRGNYTSRCGIEDLKVEFTNRVSGTYMIFMYLADECWVKNVEVNNTNYAHVYLRYSKSCEVRDSYFHHAHEYIGSWAYGVFIADINSDHLVENNIFNHCRHSMVFEGGGSGCVFGYNYSVDPQGRSSVGTPNNWLYSDISTHGRHPYMNLWEGNIAAHVSLDNFHGSSSHNTLFRNWIVGKARNTDNPNGVTNGRNVVEVMKNNTYENFIGNILGYSGCGADGYRYEQYPLVAYDRNVWVIGYTQDNPSGTRDTIPGETIIRHGNYDYVRNVVEWAPSIQDRSIPQSLYLSSKPQFFGSLPWPSIGPDLNPVAGDIPAKRRFEEIQSHSAARMPE